MMARLVGIVLGAILAATGYVITGLGVLGDWAQHLDLGPFEPHRPFVGWAATITGAVLIVAALTPRGRRRTRRRTRFAPANLDAPVPTAEAAPMDAPAPRPVAAPVAQPVAAVVPPVEAPPPAETFADLRARLVGLGREESWAEAAKTLGRLLRIAESDREKATAHCDLGDFARAQGRLDQAAEAYDEAVLWARGARAETPHDPVAIELLAGALAGVGDVAELEGRLNEALAAFEESLALRRTSSGASTADPGARRALSVTLERLADLREDRGHRMRALDLYRESYDVAACLAAADPARFGADLAATRARLAELEARIAG
ncbi:MAG: tetratricopeptide repeat protein [Caulobacter sp.]|nr:tetratricopeptide repeat protein [Caulobacter sp.]